LWDLGKHDTNVQDHTVKDLAPREALKNIEHCILPAGGQYLNSAAFVEAARGTVGALRPNAIRRPIFKERDTSVQKLFKIRENIGMECRADMFNVPNHFSDFGVQTTLRTGNLGEETSASDPWIYARSVSIFHVLLLNGSVILGS